jgi:hypothetical protein
LLAINVPAVVVKAKEATPKVSPNPRRVYFEWPRLISWYWLMITPT